MNITHLRRVRRLFCSDPTVPKHTQRHNCVQWVKSVRYLGDKWLLANTRRPGDKNGGQQ